MTYATTLASVFGKRPIWLYEIDINGTVYRYTSASEDYTDGSSVVWTSKPISHTRFRVTSVIGRAETEIIIPQNDALASDLQADTGYDDNSLTIYHEYKDKSPEERVTKFVGRIIGVKPFFTRTVALAENRFTELRRKGLAAVIQRPCRHALYHSKAGLGCGLNIADFESSVTATAYTGNGESLTVPGASAQADGYYSGGVITFGSPAKRQFISRHSGSTLTLLAPLPGLTDEIDGSGSAAVDIAPGCNLTRQVCNDRFNNLANFGGFPWADETPYDGKTLY